MLTSLIEVGSEDVASESLVFGRALPEIDIYSHDAEIRRRIAEEHRKHGLDLAKLAAQSEGVSRFIPRQPVAAMAPPPQKEIQGELYHIQKVCERPNAVVAQSFRISRSSTLAPSPSPSPASVPSNAHASPFSPVNPSVSPVSQAYPGYPSNMDFSVASRTTLPPSQCLLACAGIDILNATIFPILEQMKRELVESSASIANKNTVDERPTSTSVTSDTVPSSARSPSSSLSSTTAPSPVTSRSFTLRNAFARLVSPVGSAPSSSSSLSSSSLYGLTLLGDRFLTSTLFAYAATMSAFAAEASHQAQTEADLASLIEPIQGKLEIIGPSSSSSSTSASNPVKLSNAAIPKRAAFDE